MVKGRLYLVPAPLDFGCEELSALTDVLPAGTLAAAARIRHWICENARTTRAHLKRIGGLTPLLHPVQTMQIQELPRIDRKPHGHPNSYEWEPLLLPALDGEDIGLMSEAGMPAIADPGSSVVKAAHKLHIDVVPLVGPSSIVLALAASGLNGQNFSFVGYLPQQVASREERIRDLESRVRNSGQTQIFIETPYRNEALLSSLVKILSTDMILSVSAGITLPRALHRSGLIGWWRDFARADFASHNDLPAIYCVGK